MSKLAALRELMDLLAWIEGRWKETRASDPTRVDQEAATLALACVIDHLDHIGAKVAPLRHLLAALQEGEQHNLMGRIAGCAHVRAMGQAVLEGRQRANVRQGAEWVANNLPGEVHAYLSPNAEQGKPVTAGTIYSWYARWGGKHGDRGAGRDGYLFIMRHSLKKGTIPSEEGLRRVLQSLAQNPAIHSRIPQYI